jgi:hypothetical protein
MCNFIDSKAFVSVPLKQDSTVNGFIGILFAFLQTHSRQLFLGVVKIPETSEDLTIQLWSWKTKSKKVLSNIYKPLPTHPLRWAKGSYIMHLQT